MSALAPAPTSVQVMTLFTGDHTLPAPDQVIFVCRTRTVVVQSCAIDSFHSTIKVRRTSITARHLGYLLQRGEKRVAAEELSEAAKLAALLNFSL